MGLYTGLVKKEKNAFAMHFNKIIILITNCLSFIAYNKKCQYNNPNPKVNLCVCGGNWERLHVGAWVLEL